MPKPIIVEEKINAVGRVSLILDMLQPVPDDWKDATKAIATKSSKRVLECVECTSYRQLTSAWRKALKWTDGLDRALSVMLASIASTKAVGDPLWVKIVGPASCGKSTLCEAVSVNKKHVVAKSTIRGFHSGFSSSGDSDEDNSLLASLYDKSLVIKDGDTLLQSPNLGQILSEARDIYDGSSRTHYRNKMSKDYEGINMTLILCGTSSLRTIDSSELGERFLDCVIMDGIDDEFENEVLWRVANRTVKNMSIEANGQPETQHDPAMIEAMQLTGGYIHYLRDNAQKLLSEVSTDDNAMRHCIRLGKFVAYMRARPSKQQEETAEREFGARLVSQHTRLATCLAIVLNRSTLDEEVLKRTTRVALDTARGQTLDIADHLFDCGENGSELEAVSMHTSKSKDKLRLMLRFLKQIGAVEFFSISRAKGVRGKIRYRLSKQMMDLYEDVII